MQALRPKSGPNKPRHNRIKPKKWYDKSCQELSKNLKLVASLLSKSPKDPYLRGKLITTRKEYKKLLKLKRKEYHNEIIQKLERAEEKDPKEYWKLVNKLRKNKLEKKISNTEDFVNFFENLFSEKEELQQHEQEMKEYVEDMLKNIEGKEDFTLEEFLHAIKIFKKSCRP